jgi:hypothetical protein
MKDFENYVILEGKAPAFVVELGKSSTAGISQEAGADDYEEVKPKNKPKEIKWRKWGTGNDFPVKMLANAWKSNILASNLDFNARLLYGDCVQVVRKQLNNGKIEIVPVLDSEETEIFDFLAENNFPLLLQELIHDVTLLHNGFVEFVMNKEYTKIAQVRHKEATFSRLSVMSDKGEIEYHGYCADWSKAGDDEYPVVATNLLDFDNPLYDFKAKMGKNYNAKGVKQDKKISRHVLHIAPPTPGKFYYQKAYWWSIFESHWFDFSCAIPEFKMNLMKNQMTLKYHVQIRKGFFDDIFKEEGITDPEKQKARKAAFYQQLEDFLSGKENAGKNLASLFEYDVHKGIEKKDIIVTPIESFIKGGEYIEDSEEASNAICYAMGIHPSLQGASPGKGKTINGTEARELFIIKQAMMKPLRDLLLSALEIVKEINGWNEDIEFIIPNLMLTTLDKNTGAEKQIGNTND